jgi:hypothetical protein
MREKDRMKASAKKLSIPTLLERVEALAEELEDALDALAAERRAAAAKGVEGGVPPPMGTFRRELDARGYGDCLCRSYRATLKDH